MKRVISLFMAMLMVCSMFTFLDVSAFAAFKAPEGRMITAVKSYELAPGIEEQRIVTNSYAGDHQVKAYVAIADFNDPNVGFLAGYKDYDASGTWGMQTVRDQMRAASEAKGVKVVAGINADYFDMATGKPYGALIMDGKEVSSPAGQPHYFAILKDGTPVIRDSSEGWDDVEYAIGAPLRIVVGGAVIDNPDTSLLPRCAIGITKDNKVIIYTADGRQAPTSVGETVYATGQMMKALGCVEAVYLDGGGSSTYASQLATESGITVKSKPSDGTERKVSTTALLYYKSEAGAPSDKPVEVPTTPSVPSTPSVPDSSCAHTWIAATCTSAKKCSKCGTTEGTALGHTEVDVAGVPATCEKDGITDGKKCKVCGTPTVVQAEIPATGHTEVVVPAKAATCLEKGLTEGKKCSVCDKVIVAQTETALGEHVAAGNACSVCGKVLTVTPEITLAKVKSLKVKKTTSTSATLSWKKVANAESYKVYYSTNGKSWKSKTTKKTTLTIKKLSAAKKYQFKVKAVAGDVEGAFSSVVKGTTKYSTATLSSVKSSKKAQATVTWKKLSSASGYVVEYSTSKKFTKKTTKKVTIKKAKTTKTTLKKLKSGKKYYVRVKAYKTVSKKAVYGNYSSVKTVKVK